LDGVSSPGRPHVAQLLVKKKYVKTTQEAFEKYLASGKPAFVKKERMQSIEAVKLLRKAEAVPVLAHPLTVKQPNLRTFIELLLGEGLMGVEVEYDYSFMGMHRKPDEVKELIRGLDVIHTGGSDYHGTINYTELGSVTVPTEVIDALSRLRSES
jgi:predicted metal-dependent phosphoesterase TrpH